MRTAVVVGHDICGCRQFATVPVVTVETPRQVLRRKARARCRTPATACGLCRGGLTLRSCAGPGTGFTNLMREAGARPAQIPAAADRSRLIPASSSAPFARAAGSSSAEPTGTTTSR